MTSSLRRTTGILLLALGAAAAVSCRARSSPEGPPVRRSVTERPAEEDAGQQAAAEGAAERPGVDNVIVLIVDGCGSEQYTLARWFQDRPLALDAIRVGAVQTHVSDSVIADSAPAGSAYATGYRTGGQVISVGPRETPVSDASTPGPQFRLAPLATVLEGARLLGKATGVVATSRVTHATPAAYMAHVPQRSQENDILEQAVYQGTDVVLGGGRRHLLPVDEGGKRDDGEDLAAVLEEHGYQLPRTRDELIEIASGKVFGLFADSHLAAELDRPELAPGEPSLEDMTRKAIELLADDPDGFFLMVEASQVDWACHANDPAHLISDLLMYDRAVKRALDFAKQDGHTLVLALSDHNTGGMSIGNYATNKHYAPTDLGWLLDPLRKMKRSAFAIWKQVGDEPTPEKVKAVVEESWGLEISDEEADRILDLAAEFGGSGAHNALGNVLCPKYTPIGWTTHGHTGGDVPLFAFGPGRPVGLLDGPEVGTVTAEALGLDLERLNRRLFQEAAEALPHASVTVEEPTPNNFVVKVQFNGQTAELPANKNLLTLGEKTIELEGVTVCVGDKGTQKAYLPMQAVNLIKGAEGKLPQIRASATSP